MARKRDRAFALTMAVLFFATAFGFSFFVIWQMVSSNKNSSSQSGSNTASNTSSQQKTDKLKGTKLKNFTPVASVDKVQTADTKVGTGAQITSDSQTISVIYTGAVASTGVIFQSNADTGSVLTDPLNQLIPGWQEGMVGMKVGGTRRILIPASQAYGANPPAGSGIPANAALVFDITLLNVK